MVRGLYPASFDPIHYGHIDIATRAAAIFDELVVGVYDRPSKSLLFSLEERLALVREALRHLPNVTVTAYSGLTVEFARRIGAQVIVRGLRVISDFELELQMALTNKQLAPEIEVVCLMTSRDYAFISSSVVREIALLGGDVSTMVPPHVARALAAKAAERTGETVAIISIRE
ncbi:MAG: pantetheine-phosphate adenylyltransferase [Anaerolineae bacterium]|nr:pantetheine-phosphate adenylyltransferase [Thermoflexus sp.]MDW8064676.1 pantetheine-phosphate adenylyltransferase [Anaerolineae bacterium]